MEQFFGLVGVFFPLACAYLMSSNRRSINWRPVFWGIGLQFVFALGEQCFLNEYVYSFTEEENISENTIIQRCRDGEINETNISILSCYFPLYKLLDQIPSLKSFNSSNQSFKELIKLQITEPLKLYPHSSEDQIHHLLLVDH